MRILLAICAGLVLILGIVSGTLWRELRAERQLVADMRAQKTQAPPSGPGSAQLQAPQVTTGANATPVVSAQVPEPMPAYPVAPPVSVPLPAPLPAPVNRAPVIPEAIRAAAMADSDQTATARTLAWRDRLTISGLTLTTEQLQALNAAAIAQLRRETQENLELQATARPTDMESMFRMREEAVNRQNETNLRILRIVMPQLNEEQAKALRAQFDSGHAARLKSLRAEREQAMANPN